MTSSLESTIEIKKYLNKLMQIIEKEAVFNLFKSKIFDKKRIDDIMCCVEASWPEDYKKYIANFDTRRIKSLIYYKKLMLAVKNRFLFSTNCYAIKQKDALDAIYMLSRAIDTDMKFIYSDQSGMF